MPLVGISLSFGEKMDVTLLGFLTIALCLPILAQQKTDKDLNDLQGAVHIIRSTIFLEEKTGRTVTKRIQSEYTETYNRQGNLMEKLSVFGQQIAHKSIFSRDAEGNQIEKLIQLPMPSDPNTPPPPPAPKGAGADVLEFKTTYRFDPEKRRLEAIQYRKNGELMKTDVYLFDDQGHVIEHAQKDGPTIPFGSQARWEYKRDEKGVVTESISYGKDNTVERRTRYQYIFDTRGNWIRRTESALDKNGKPLSEQFTTQRTITYY